MLPEFGSRPRMSRQEVGTSAYRLLAPVAESARRARRAGSAAARKGTARLAVALFFVGILPALPAATQVATGQPPPPIQLIFDNHADPMQSIPAAARPGVYAEWRDALAWLQGVCDTRGAAITFCAVGEFMEYVAEDPSSWPLLQAVYSSGGSLGTHSHSEHRVGPHDWRNLPPSPTPAQVLDAWNDHVGAVDAAVAAIFGLSDPNAIRQINNLRGTHVPADDADRIALMAAFGFRLHQQGPCEQFYVYFRHYALNPYRPSGTNFLVHDPSGPVINSPFGPVLGTNSLHFGIVQDMRLPAVQARFLLTLLNWLDDALVSHTERVWVTGWGSHCSDIIPGGVSRPIVIPALDWHKTYFVDETVSGVTALEFSSATRAADLHETWEAEHPGQVSFSYAPATTDWRDYPYLMPVARYLADAQYVSAAAASGVRLHRLTAGPAAGGPFPMWVAYPTAGEGTTVDLAPILGMPTVLTVSPRTGLAPALSSAAVPVPTTGLILVPPDRRLPLPNGDVNLDGRLTFDDIDPFVAVLLGIDTNPARITAADVNRDGIVTFDDIDPFVALLGE